MNDLNQSKFSQYIVVVNSQSKKAKGGFISDIPIIVISSNALKRTVLHELSHSLFKLGDEYGGILDFLPSEREISKFKNLSLVKYNEEWIRIKEMTNDPKINFYEGGLERNKGVYRSYPECLMRNVKDDLCPVCLYYSNQILSDITGKNIDYKELLKTKKIINEKIYPKVINLEIEILGRTTKRK
ncbi:MAG TPA: M64 family metallopeptidase [Spirochaetota bacterium]|nr:M64 family metallopeptidase [Spirochaetota bacterium]